tara:strand:+ start:103 stop:1305 length:1203 start_codon:yes stop_codon:yes gene_type:complete
MKILLVSFYNNEAYGVRILHSILINKGYDARMLFIEENNSQLVAELVKEFKPDILGFSVVSLHFGLYKKLYNDIRELGKFKILLGGWQPTLNPQECLPYCDSLCRGEGEGIILKIVEDLGNNRANKVYTGELKPVDYPTFKFDNGYSYVIENGELIQKEPYFENTRYGTMIGRGCPYHCTYCSNSYMCQVYPDWSKIRYRDIDKVMEELREVKRKLPAVERINFYDEVFLLREKRINEFTDKYKREINLPFYCMFYPGTCSEEMADKLTKVGLVGVWIGVQSGSERVRREVFKRNYTNAALWKQIKIFQKYNISIKYDFIFDNPFETREEFLETIALIRKLPKPLLINMFSLKFFPNTEITKMALERGLINKTTDQLNTDVPRISVSDERREEIMGLINS